MPFVHVHLVKGVLNDEKKQELQQRLTDLMTDIEGHEQFRQLVWVKIDEDEAANWCIGGEQVSLEKIKAILESA
ncbi:MAG: tautomerase family protein [Candidatus Hydrogenedentota bacterium]|nr:MAG: tautomerase family protein [Candidatus Hydrogenedentota bacterium]